MEFLDLLNSIIVSIIITFGLENLGSFLGQCVSFIHMLNCAPLCPIAEGLLTKCEVKMDG